MRKLTIAAGTTAMAIALSQPVALAQTAPNPEPSPQAASRLGSETGPGMMYGAAQAQPAGQVQRQMEPQGQVGYGPGMMNRDGAVQVQGGYGSGMMGGYGANWMGGYGGIWVPVLLVGLLVVGLVVWVVKRKAK